MNLKEQILITTVCAFLFLPLIDCQYDYYGGYYGGYSGVYVPPEGYYAPALPPKHKSVCPASQPMHCVAGRFCCDASHPYCGNQICCSQSKCVPLSPSLPVCPSLAPHNCSMLNEPNSSNNTNNNSNSNNSSTNITNSANMNDTFCCGNDFPYCGNGTCCADAACTNTSSVNVTMPTCPSIAPLYCADGNFCCGNDFPYCGNGTCCADAACKMEMGNVAATKMKSDAFSVFLSQSLPLLLASLLLVIVL